MWGCEWMILLLNNVITIVQVNTFLQTYFRCTTLLGVKKSFGLVSAADSPAVEKTQFNTRVWYTCIFRASINGQTRTRRILIFFQTRWVNPVRYKYGLQCNIVILEVPTLRVTRNRLSKKVAGKEKMRTRACCVYIYTSIGLYRRYDACKEKRVRSKIYKKYIAWNITIQARRTRFERSRGTWASPACGLKPAVF